MGQILKAVVLMGGEGLRFGSDLPKQFHSISGKKVYLHTLEQLIRCQLFAEIILVCPEDHLDEVKKEIPVTSPFIKVVAGGKTRQESSYLGLQACGNRTDFVLIHDGVRPFVSQEIVRANIEAVKKHQAVDTCIPSADTLVHAPDGELIEKIPIRSEYYRGQTPQSFHYPLILQAHEKAIQKGIINCSDDCSLVLSMGHSIAIVAGSEQNIKITTELDLFIAEQLFRLQQKTNLENLPNRSLKGKCFAVTGGTGGIGQAICTLLEKEGALPLVISQSAEQYPIDLTSASAVEKLFEKIHQEHGPLDGLINSVGQLQVKSLKDLSIEEIDEQVDVNLLSVIFCCKFAKIKEGGHMVNIASSSYFRGRKNYPIYSSAKAAIVNFTQALSEERSEIHVNILIPQRTHTKMRLMNFPNEDVSSLLAPEEVARSVIDLLKKESVTGSIIEVRKA